ncbi:MAG: M24 family metallopeptidase [Planctomycetota bacterium]|jgi:Xaa-Pro aminopeptidase
MNLEAIQSELQDRNIPGWLFYDFMNRDHLAYRVLGLDYEKKTSRRWFYYIPAQGEPVRLVSKVEPTRLDALPGGKRFYLTWEDLHQSLKDMLGEPKQVAMQYSPNNNIPYVSIVDGGTLELIRSFGHQVVSSADLVQRFEGLLDEAGYQTHVKAGEIVQRVKNEAFAEIGKALADGRQLTEFELSEFILRRFGEEGITCGNDRPIVGINDHPADPHFEPKVDGSHVFKNGDKVLIDLWGKLKDNPSAVYYDITWCGYVGDAPDPKHAKIFQVVCKGRDAAIDLVRERFGAGMTCFGWEVDDACRKAVKDAGFGNWFVHRTGHSIGKECHGNAVHIDNLETKDERLLVPGICFSIEPGLYFEGEMAVRTEIDCFITLDGEVTVSGDVQTELIRIPPG